MAPSGVVSTWKGASFVLLLFGFLAHTLDGQFSYSVVADNDFFIDIRTAVLRFLTRTGDKPLFKNIPGLQCQNGTAETSGFLD